MAIKTQKEPVIKLSEESLLILKNFLIKDWEYYQSRNPNLVIDITPSLSDTLDRFIRMSAGAFQLPSYDHCGDIHLEWKE